MKTFNFIFSLILLALISLPNVAVAQNYDDVYVIEETDPIPANETKKERKERIKKDHQIVDSIFHLKAERAAFDGYFVLQATQVSNSRGHYELGLNDSTVWIAEHNIRAGVRYLQHLQGKWSFIRNIPEQTKFVLASYNAGPGPIFSARRTVRDTGGNPYVWSEVEPYVYQEETRRYVKQVLWLSNKYKNESLRRQNDSIRNSQ